MNKDIKNIHILNIPVSLFTIDSLHGEIEKTIKNNKKKIFMHANARLVELAHYEEPWIIDFFNKEVDYVICDGSGIQLAAKLTNQSVPQKIPYNIWIWDLVRFLAKNNFSLYFLGSSDSILKAALNRIRKIEPNITIKGWHNGYFQKGKNDVDNKSVIEDINKKSPDVILIGFGMPLQEKWIKENHPLINVKGIFSCGGAFDFISGNKPVAPKFFRKYYLEWLFRFLIEPKRLFTRAFFSNGRFAFLLFKSIINHNAFTRYRRLRRL